MGAFGLQSGGFQSDSNSGQTSQQQFNSFFGSTVIPAISSSTDIGSLEFLAGITPEGPNAINNINEQFGTTYQNGLFNAAALYGLQNAATNQLLSLGEGGAPEVGGDPGIPGAESGSETANQFSRRRALPRATVLGRR